MPTIAEEYVTIFDANDKPYLDAHGRMRDALGRYVKATETANNAVGLSFKGLGDKLRNVSESFSKVGTSLSIGVTLPLTLLAKQIASIGADYEKSMNIFQAVTRASSEEMARAAKVAQQLGADMSLPATSAADAAGAMTELAKGGFTAAQAMDAAKGALQLAAAAGITEAEAATITANALNTFHLAATEAARVSDLLAATANASSAEISDVALALAQSGSSAAALKIPIEDLTTAIGMMANAGIKGCYDDQTDVLTREGFKHWRDVTMDDEFATLSPQTNRIEYQRPIRLIRYHHKGAMYEVKNKRINLCVTPDHRMWVRRRGQDRFEVLTAREVAGKSVEYAVTGEWIGENADFITLPAFEQPRGGRWTKSVPELRIDADTWAAFLGYFLAEGSTDYDKGSYRISIAQKDGPKKDKMREDLMRLPFNVHEGKRAFTILNEQLYRALEPLGKTKEKRVPFYAKQWSVRLLKILYGAFRLGDGDSNGKLYTASRHLRDDFEEIITKCGWGAGHRLEGRAGDTTTMSDGRVVTATCNQWGVLFNKTQLTPAFDQSEYKSPAHASRLKGLGTNIREGWIDYDGEVFCATVPNGLLFVRRGGRVIVSGNSDAGTSLKTFMAALIPTTEKAAGAMTDLGIHAFDAAGNFVGLETIIKQAAPALAKMTDQQQQYAIKVAFGSDAQRAANILLGEGVAKFTEMNDAVTRSGAAADIAGARTKGLAGAWEGLKSQLETTALKIYEQVAPGLETVVRKVADLAGKLADLDPLVAKVGITLAGVFGASGPAALGIAKLAALFANPLGLAVSAAIISIGALAAAYVTNFGQMQKTIDSFAQIFTSDFGTIGQILSKTASGVDLLAVTFAGMIDGALSGIKILLNSLESLGRVVVATVKGQWLQIPDIIREGSAKGQQIFDEFEERRVARARETHAILEGGWRKHFDMLAMLNSKAGSDSAKAFTDSFLAQAGAKNPIQGLIEQVRAGQVDAVAVARKAGIDISEAINTGIEAGEARRKKIAEDVARQLERAMRDAQPQALAAANELGAVGGVLGSRFRSQLNKELFKSPFVFVHILLDELPNAKLAAAGYEAVGKLLGESFKKGLKLANVKDAWRDTIKELYEGLVEHNVEQQVSQRLQKLFSPILTKLKDARQTIKIEIAQINETFTTIGPSAETGFILPFIEALNKAQKASNAFWQSVIDKTKAFEKAKEEAERYSKALSSTFEDLSRQLPSSWNRIIDGILTASGKLGDGLLKLGNKVKGWAADIIGVVDTLPGKFGDAARGVLRTVDQWVAFADKVLAILSRLTKGAIPANLEGLVIKIADIFKKSNTQIVGATEMTQDQIQKAAKAASQGMGEMAASSEQSSSRIAQAIGKIGAAIASVAGLVGSFKSGSILGGAASGAGLGAIIGGLFKHSTLGGILGVIGGGLVGLIGKIFGGKSELEKLQEAAAKEQARAAAETAKQSVLQAVEATKQSILDTVAKAREILESIRFYESIGKPAIKAFFKDLSRFFKLLAAEAENWKKFAAMDIKAAAEQLGAGVDLIAKLPAALNAISTHFKVGESKIALFFADALSFFNALGRLVEEIPNQIEKKIGKFGRRVGEGISLMGPLIEAIKGMTDIPDVPEANFARIESILQRIIEGMSRVASNISKSLQKAVGFLAENVGPAVELWKGTIDAIKSAVDVPMLKESDADNIVSGMRLFVDRLIAGFANFNTEGLSTVVAIAQAILPLAAAIEAWAKATEAVKGYTSIAAETWESISADFARAKDMISLMLKSAIDFLPKAVQFEDVMKAIASHLHAGLAALGSGLQSAASAFGAVVGAISGGSPIGGEGSSFAASSFPGGGGFAPIAVGGGSVLTSAPVVDRSITIQFGPQSFQVEDPEVRMLVTRLAEILTGQRGLAQLA